MDKLRLLLVPIAKKHPASLQVVHVPESETEVYEYFEISAPPAAPSVLVVDMSRGLDRLRRYPYIESPDGVSTPLGVFVEAVLAGMMPPSVKSEAVSPEDTRMSPVVVRAASLETLVLDGAASLDVLLMIYAPWCEHSQALAPIYTELAHLAQSEPSLRIAKIDGTTNDVDVEGAVVNGFPTVLLFSAANKSAPIEFDGDEYTVPKLIHFLHQYTTHPLVALPVPSEQELAAAGVEVDTTTDVKSEL